MDGRYDKQRLEELRAIEHRSLAMYALEIEERLRRWRDLQAAISLSVISISAAAGVAAGYLLCRFS